MKPQSSSTFRLIRDKHGTSRREYYNPCIDCGKERWSRASKTMQRRCNACATKLVSTPERNKKISETLRSKYTDPSYKELVKLAQNPAKGYKHWNWKGGITPENQIKRNSEEYFSWRKKVYERDLYHCRLCKENSDKLHSHHIFSWAAYPELRFDINNGITLCEDCHSRVHIYLKEIEHQTTKLQE